MELPLGVFTIAVATVFFPLMARKLSLKDESGFCRSFLQGLRLVACISLPAGIGLLVLGEPIVECLFLWGAFNQADVADTVPLLAIYGIGLPFYSAATFATRGLHASKDMRTPVRVAGYCLLINLFAGLGLMQIWGAAGLAAANVLAAIAQSWLLWRSLATGRETLRFRALRPALVKLCLAGAGMGLACGAAWPWLAGFGLGAKLDASLAVALCVPGGACLYFALLYLLRFEELDALKGLLRRFVPGSKG
jgi:putative peptidoglycan lipid II flippase